MNNLYELLKIEQISLMFLGEKAYIIMRDYKTKILMGHFFELIRRYPWLKSE